MQVEVNNLANEIKKKHRSVFKVEIMSGNKLDVLWSPIHHNKFIVWGQDITLYDVVRLQDIEKKSTCTYKLMCLLE